MCFSSSVGVILLGDTWMPTQRDLLCAMFGLHSSDFERGPRPKRDRASADTFARTMLLAARRAADARHRSRGPGYGERESVVS